MSLHGDPLDDTFPAPTPSLIGDPLEDVKKEFGGPSGGEVVEAAFRQENIVSSFYAASQRTVLEDDDIDPDFDPVGRAVEDGIHGEDLLKYADAINVEDYDNVKARIDAENEDRRIIAEGGAFGVYSSIGASVLSPINFVPVAGVTAKLGSAGLKFWQGAAVVGGVASTTVGIEEGLLHASQTERTVEESAYAVSGAMFLGGLLGAAASKVDPVEFAGVSKKVDEQSHADPHTQYTATRNESQVFAESGLSVGADALKLTDEMGETLLNEKQIRVINLSTGGKFMPGLSPVVQVKAVQLPLKIKSKMSKYVDLMANNFLLGGKVLDGVKMDQATELVFKQIDGAVMDAQRDASKAFVDYHNATTGGAFLGKKVSRIQFEKNVYQAMLTGTFEHVDDALMPHIKKASESYRKHVYNPIRDLAIENKLLPEDVGADEMFQYMNRNPNRQALVGNKRKYLTLQSDYMEKQTIEAIENAKVEHIANIAAKEKEVTELSTTSKKIEAVEAQVGKLKTEGVDKAVETSVKKETKRLEKARSAKKRSETGRRKRIENRFAKKLEAATKKAEGLKTAEGKAKRIAAETKKLEAQKANELTSLEDSIKKTDADLAKSIKEIDVDSIRSSAKEKIGKSVAEREELAAKLKERRAGQKDVARAQVELEDLKGLDVARDFVRATNPALAEGAFNVDVMVKRFARASAEKTYSRYLGLAPGSPAGLEAMAESGPLAKRTNKIPDRYTVIDPVDGEEIIFSDFMNQDMAQLSHSYARFMMPKVELKQKFGSLMEGLPGQKGTPNGTVKWSDIERDLQKSFDEELHGVKDLTEEDISAYNRSKDTMKFMFEMLDGTYKTGLNDPDSIIQRGLKAMNQLNVMRLLGDIVKSSFIDPAKLVMSHGFARAFDGQLRGMSTQLNNLFSGSTPAIKAELNSFGIALNTELATRILQMSELGDPYAAGSAFENFMNNSVKTFTKMTGFSYWNDTMQLASGITNQKRLYDLATGDLAFDSLSKSDKTYLLASGIDADALGAIEDMLIKHGDTKSTKGLAVFNYDQWTDPVAKDISQKFIIKNSMFDVMEPGIGDIPQVMRSSAGKVMGQFKSFNMTATNSILASGLQRNDKAFYQGLVSMVGLGMMVYAVKELSHGREISTDPRKLILEGFDRSGILGTWSDVNNITEKMTGYGLSSLTGEEGAGNSRYRSRSAVEAVLGPSMGTFANFAAVSNAMFSGEVKREDLHNIRKLTPYQNHPIFAHGADQIEKGAASLFGIKKTKKRRKKK